MAHHKTPRRTKEERIEARIQRSEFETRRRAFIKKRREDSLARVAAKKAGAIVTDINAKAAAK